MSFLLRPSSRPVNPFGPSLWLASFGLLSTLCLTLPAHAATSSDSQQALAQLEERANQANPREQCFLYAQIVHTMTEQAGQQIANGDTEQAAATLKQVNHYAGLLHLNIARNAKRLKDAEELIHNTTFRLAECLHLVSGPDKATVQDTLKQLDQVNDELLTQVFAH
ncbi:MAG: hypothetical protein ABSG84_12570 [Acidobacteriaceae bacterium]|jgi:hypothetical protein